MKRLRAIAALLSCLSFGFHAGDLASEVAKRKGNRQPKQPGQCVCSDWNGCGCDCNNPWRMFWSGNRQCPCKRVFFKCDKCDSKTP